MSNALTDTPIDSTAALKSALESLPSRLRLSDNDAEVVYAIAYQAIAQARLQDAFRHLSLLSLYRPTNAKYLNALARTMRLLDRHEEAIQLYAFLAVIDVDSEALHHNLNIAECLLLLRSYEEAHQQTELIINACKEIQSSDSEKVLARAQALADLSGLNKHDFPN